jgi:hypothetical protein
MDEIDLIVTAVAMVVMLALGVGIGVFVVPHDCGEQPTQTLISYPTVKPSPAKVPTTIHTEAPRTGALVTVEVIEYSGNAEVIRSDHDLYIGEVYEIYPRSSYAVKNNITMYGITVRKT